MSLFSTMNTATSGLGAASANLSVIGDNIANMGTTGFKASRTEFSEHMPQDIFGKSGPSQLGTGAGLDRVATLFGQGAVKTSSNALDMAISGDGFFAVSDSLGTYYTRAGEFYLDDNGFVVTSQGYKLQGFSAKDGALGATLNDLQIDINSLAPSATATITMAANLSAESDFSDAPVAGLDLTSGTGDTLVTAGDEGDFATSVTVYDSLGVSHEVTMVFERTGTNDWDWYALVDAGEVDIAALGGTGTSGSAYQISSGSLTFDTDGNMSGFSQTDTAGWNFQGAQANPSFAFDFGMDTGGNTTDGQVRMNNGDSAVSSLNQDGFGNGTLASLSVDASGVITGVYSNGEEMVMGQVALARFASNQGLARVGSNLFRATLDAGSPAIGAPDSGGRGAIQGSALEQSNVDIEGEFVNMITSQRSYQANARVVNTANDTLQELVNLV